jgi:hypothetical protein
LQYYTPNTEDRQVLEGRNRQRKTSVQSSLRINYEMTITLICIHLKEWSIGFFVFLYHLNDFLSDFILEIVFYDTIKSETLYENTA